MNATATATRLPTEAEIIETNALQSTVTKAADSLQARAGKDAVRAYGKADSFTYDAVLSTALALCGEQIRETLTEGEYKPEIDNMVFKRAVLLPIALDGGMIYRDTATEAADVVAKPAGKARKAEAIAYINMKGGKYVEGLAKLRTYAFRLAAFYRDVHGQADGNTAIIVEAARLSGTVSIDAAVEYFRNVVADRFGSSFAKLSDGLDRWHKAKTREAKFKGGAVTTVSPEDQAKADAQNEREAETARDQRDPVGAIMRSVVNLTDEQFQSLMFRLRGEAEDRTARHTPAQQDNVQDGDIVEAPRQIAA